MRARNEQYNTHYLGRRPRTWCTVQPTGQVPYLVYGPTLWPTDPLGPWARALTTAGGNMRWRVRSCERVAKHLHLYRHSPHNFAHVDHPGPTLAYLRANLDGAFVIKLAAAWRQPFPRTLIAQHNRLNFKRSLSTSATGFLASRFRFNSSRHHAL